MRVRVPWQLQLNNLQKVLAVVLVLASISFILFWRLGSLTPGFSPAENSARQNSQELGLIAKNPLYGPHKLIQYGVQAAGYNGNLAMRGVSVLFALIFLGCLYKILREWFGTFIGAVGVLLAAGMPWFILISRSATPDIMLLSPLMPAAVLMWLDTNRRRAKWFFLLFCVAVAFCLYTPGAIWLLIIGSVVGYKLLRENFKRAGRKTIMTGLSLLVILLIPLLWASANNWHVIRELLLIPVAWPDLVETFKKIVWSALSLLWRTPSPHDFIIGRMSLLSITQIALIIFGVYALLSQARRILILLLSMLSLSVILSGLSDSLALLTLGLPAVFIMVTAGLRYLYAEWHTIFPRNPLPHALAVILIVMLTSLYMMFGIRYSLIAWPHTDQTRQLYVIE